MSQEGPSPSPPMKINRHPSPAPAQLLCEGALSRAASESDEKPAVIHGLHAAEAASGTVSQSQLPPQLKYI